MYMGENTWERIKMRPTFFALSHAEAEEEYGVTYEFVTKKECKLLALDHKETVSELLSTVTDVNIRKIIELHYGHKSTRNSNLKDDLLITNYLCNEGYEGYATKEMVTDFGGKFHSEIMICNPNFVGLPKQVTVDEQKIQEIIADYKDKRIARRLKEERDTKRRMQKKSFFEEEQEEEDEDNFNRFQSNSSNIFSTVLFPKSSSPAFTPPRSNLFSSSPAFTPPRSIRISSSVFHSPPSHKKTRRSPSPKKGGKNKNKKNKSIKIKSKNKKL